MGGGGGAGLNVVLDAVGKCVERVGLAKVTAEDIAREADISRATLYRRYPGGRDELISQYMRFEVDGFFSAMADHVADAPDYATMLRDGLMYAARAAREHRLLQRLLDREPVLLLDHLQPEVDRVRSELVVFLRERLETADLEPGVDLEEAADYQARLLLSYIEAWGSFDLEDAAVVGELVRKQFLSGIVTNVT